LFIFSNNKKEILSKKLIQNQNIYGIFFDRSLITFKPFNYHYLSFKRIPLSMHVELLLNFSILNIFPGQVLRPDGGDPW